VILQSVRPKVRAILSGAAESFARRSYS